MDEKIEAGHHLEGLRSNLASLPCDALTKRRFEKPEPTRHSTSASRTPPWLPSGWGCRGRRLSRGRKSLDRLCDSWRCCRSVHKHGRDRDERTRQTRNSPTSLCGRASSGIPRLRLCRFARASTPALAHKPEPLSPVHLVPKDWLPARVRLPSLRRRVSVRSGPGWEEVRSAASLCPAGSHGSAD